jgi:DNA mismatch repair protein MutL
VIHEPWCSIKELLENALDAGATSVEVVVRMDANGFSTIDVRDNGHGIPTESRPLLGKRHHTSKLRDFIELQGCRTFGFRGEALHSLVEASDRVEVTTKTKGELTGVTFLLGERDEGKEWQKRCSCLPGTKIRIYHLLKSFPVRSQMYKGTTRKAKAKRSQQGNKIVFLVRAFALFYPAGT